jgi:hypothetical protein
MNHAVTIADVLFILGTIIGLIAGAIGVLMIAAAGMSDAGDDGTGSRGCIVLVIGGLLCAGCIGGLFL